MSQPQAPSRRGAHLQSIGGRLASSTDQRLSKLTLASVVSFACVLGCTLFLFSKLDAGLLFANTTDNGGDTGAHVLIPWELSQQLLPHWRLSGWSPSWYDGFPLLTFYFPLPSILVLTLGHVFTYNVAFKLVTVLGTLLLPLAAWSLGRAARLPRPLPECMTLAVIPFLLERNYSIYGGNLASTLAGEFDFSLSLTLALFLLAAVFSGLHSGRRRAVASFLMATCLLSHIIPAMLAIVGAVVIVGVGVGRGGLKLSERLRWAVPIAAVSFCLVAFWLIPFYWFRQYETNMDYLKSTDYIHELIPPGRLWVFILACLGLGFSAFRRRRLGLLLAFLATVFALFFVKDNPIATAIYNYRLVPLFVICVYLLAGMTVGELGILLGQLVRSVFWFSWAYRRYMISIEYMAAHEPSDSSGTPDVLVRGFQLRTRRAAKWAALTAAVIFPAVMLGGSLAGAQLIDWDGWSALGVTPSFLPSWIDWNYSGYQEKNGTGSPPEAYWTEYQALIKTMGNVGKRFGCGRAMWEYGPELGQLGTTWALTLLPYWTGNCIDSMEGLLTESSATTPFHFINQSELSQNPSDPEGGLTYGTLSAFTLGIRHLQELGVRYYMAFTPAAEAEAALDPYLVQVAQSGPWPTGVNSTVVNRTWRIYLVRGSSTVVPLSYQPVVMTHIPAGGQGWLTASMAWYLDPGRQRVDYLASGPASWTRLSWQVADPPLKKEPKVKVTDVNQGTDTISFNVSRVGVPILVRTSYFPDWQAVGAHGPWRAAPNLMVVVPTSHHVVLRYGRSLVEWVGVVLTLAGIVALVVLALADRRRLLRGLATKSKPQMVVPESVVKVPQPKPWWAVPDAPDADEPPVPAWDPQPKPQAAPLWDANGWPQAHSRPDPPDPQSFPDLQR